MKPMKKEFIVLVLFIVSINLKGQIIADHTVVDKFEDIPQQYIDSVKKMWVQVLGESHSAGYRNGITDFAAAYPKYAGFGREYGTLEGPEAGHLRLNRYWWSYDPNTGDYQTKNWYRFGGGEEDFWTTQWAVNNVKENITYCNDSAKNIVTAVGFGWCWDMINGTGGTVDPVYGCRWSGRRFYWNGSGFSNAIVWGIDDEDNELIDPDGTDTTLVNLMTYINAIEEIDAHDDRTMCFFTTGPVDVAGDVSQAEKEWAYQRFIKHEYIRNYVKENGGVLFDYGDILTYNDAGEQATESWQGNVYPVIHPDNDGEYKNSHIDSVGSIRLAKAMWWMLACVAGWDGDTIMKYKTTINVSICEGESYSAGGSNQTTSGVYYDTLKASDELDSILITHLTVNNKFNTEIYDTIMAGYSYYAGGEYQNTSGVYTDSLKTINGCDSIVIIYLYVSDSCITQKTTIDTTITTGTAININGKVYSDEGTYFDSLKTINGCDSIVIIHLYVSDSCITQKTTIDTTITTGTAININGKEYRDEGTYFDTLKTINSCDSILTINVSVISLCEETSATIDTCICKDSTIIINGREYSSAGVYNDTLKNTSNCDSILTINITEKVCAVSIYKNNVNTIKVYPNPSSGNFYINLNKIDKVNSVTIINQFGQIIYKQNGYFLNNEPRILNFNGYPAGIYIIKIISENEIRAGKLFIK